MADNLVMLANRLSDGTLWDPQLLFIDSADRATKEFPGLKKALAVFYDPDKKHIAYSQCGMNLVEIIKVLSQLHDELMFDLIEANQS